MMCASVHIITGGKNSGKTARIRALCDEKSGGDGYACPKVFAGAEHTGYDALDLRTGTAMPLARKREALPPGWDGICGHGRFSFSKRGLAFLDSILEGLVARPAARVFIDEIGPLEMRRERFRFLLKLLLDSCEELYACVRRNRVEEFLEVFGITEYSLDDLDLTGNGNTSV